MTIVNMRNGIPIVQSARLKQSQDGLWKAITNPYTHYIEMAMSVDGCEASVIMPYKYKWVQQYMNEGWHIKEVWDVDEQRNT